MDINIPPVVIPKTGTRTSSFWVLLAAWVVGGLFTGLFKYLESQELLTPAGSSAIRGWAVEAVAELLPVVYVGALGVATRTYIKARARISQMKAETMRAVVSAQVAGAGAEGGPDQRR